MPIVEFAKIVLKGKRQIPQLARSAVKHAKWVHISLTSDKLTVLIVNQENFRIHQNKPCAKRAKVVNTVKRQVRQVVNFVGKESMLVLQRVPALSVLQERLVTTRISVSIVMTVEALVTQENIQQKGTKVAQNVARDTTARQKEVR